MPEYAEAEVRLRMSLFGALAWMFARARGRRTAARMAHRRQVVISDAPDSLTVTIVPEPPPGGFWRLTHRRAGADEVRGATETVTVTARSLAIARGGATELKEYPLHRIGNFRVSSAPDGVSRSQVQFDCEHETVWLGSGLTAAEAERTLGAIVRRIGGFVR
jgi:hypothetical protein